MARVSVLIGAGAVRKGSLDAIGTEASTSNITDRLYSYDDTQMFDAPFSYFKDIKTEMEKETNATISFEDIFELLVVCLEQKEGIADIRNPIYSEVVSKLGLNDWSPEDIYDLMKKLIMRVLLCISYSDSEVPSWFNKFFKKLESLNAAGVYLDIFDLNYDNWIEKCINYENGYYAVTDEYSRFNSSFIKSEHTKNNIVHLHGCINLNYHPSEVDCNYDELFWWTEPIDSYTGQFPIHVSGNSIKICTPIVTGKNKKRCICYEPYSTYMDLLREDSLVNDVILIIGYGFGDPHINELLENYHSAGINKKQVIMIAPRDDKKSEEWYVKFGGQITGCDEYVLKSPGVTWYGLKFEEVCLNDGYLDDICDAIKTHVKD